MGLTLSNINLPISSNLTTHTVQDTDLKTEPIRWTHDEDLRSLFTRVLHTLQTLAVVGQHRAQKRVSALARMKIKTKREEEEEKSACEQDLLNAKQAKKSAKKSAKKVARKAARKAVRKAVKKAEKKAVMKAEKKAEKRASKKAAKDKAVDKAKAAAESFAESKS